MATGVRRNDPLVKLYERYVGETRKRSDAYGYWLYLLAYLLGIAGVAVFLAGPERTGLGLFVVREVAIAVTALGAALLVFGVVLQLPVRRRGIQVAILGTIVALVGVAAFVWAYPQNWIDTPNYTTQVVLVYGGGLAVVSAVIALVPLVTGKQSMLLEEEPVGQPEVEITPTEETAEDGSDQGDETGEAADVEADSQEVSEPSPDIVLGEAARGALFAIYRRGSDWTWRLIEQNVIADSGRDYDARDETSEAVGTIRETVREAGLLEIKHAAFRLYRDASGGWRWLLMRRDGSVMADSGDRYPDRQAAEESVSFMKEHGAEAELIDVDRAAFTLDQQDGEWRWTLVDEERAALSRSGGGFSSRAAARGGMRRVRNNVGGAGLLSLDRGGFELRESDGEWHWRFVDGDDVPVAESAMTYPSRRDAEAGAEEIADEVGGSTVLDAERSAFEVCETDEGVWRWRFVGSDDEVIARSHTDSITEAAAESSARTVASGIEAAEVVELDGGAFEIYRGEGAWHWRLVDDDRHQIAERTAEYATLEEAGEAIEEVREQIEGAGLIEFETAAFQLYEDEGLWRWRLIEEDGKVIADSGDDYQTREDAASMIPTLKKHAPNSELIEIENTAFELFRDSDGWGWRLIDQAGSNIATSATRHDTRQGARDALDRMRNLGPGAGVNTISGLTFEQYPDGDEWHWRLIDEDGSIVADGAESAPTRDELSSMIEDVRDEASDAEVHTLGTLAVQVLEEEGGFRWRVVDVDRNARGHAVDTYAEREAAESAATEFTRDAADAPVFEIEDAVFKLDQTDDGWRWTLVDAEREPLAEGIQAYASHEDATDALKRVRDRAPDAELLEFDTAAYEVLQEEGQWRWRLVHEDETVVAIDASGHGDRETAEQSMTAVKGQVGRASILEIETAAFELHEDAGQWRWRLVDEDGNTIADSFQAYDSRSEARSAMGFVKEFAPDAREQIAADTTA